MNKYTPAIDGLRALAVLSVIINHFNSTLLPGGYLGVDIFFVISGFVITSSLVNREETRIRTFFFGFYKRRIKRLLPALLFCFIITGILISFFNPSPQKHLITGLTSIIGFTNINLYLNAIDYWGDSARLNPFTHTWSLGVEEQFYFVFPLIIWLSIRGNWTILKIRQLTWLVFIISIISLLSFVFFSKSNQVATYFLMPYRFWEIGLGCTLFLYLKQGDHYTKPFITIVPKSVFLILIILVLFIPNDYPIIATIAIVFCTLLLILKIKNNEGSGSDILTHKVILYIGKISYSLYLWHWIVIVISRWTVGITIWTIPFQIILIIILATTSYHFIEKPFRYANWISSKRVQSFLIVSLTVVALSIISLIFEPKTNKLYLGNSELKNKISKTIYHINSELKCSHNKNNKKKQTVRILGNSHSLHILPMLGVISRKCNLNIIRQKPPNFIVIPSGDHRDIDKLNSILSILNEGDLLILSSRNRFLYAIPYLDGNGDKWIDHSTKKKYYKGFRLKNWLMELDTVINKANKIGVNVILFLPNVEFDQQVLNYEEMCTDEWFRIQPKGCNPTVSKEFLNSRFPKQFYEEVHKRVVKSGNFYIFDPMPIYCPQEQEECSRIIDGIVAFQDTNHLTRDGAKLMLNEFSLFLAHHNLIKND